MKNSIVLSVEDHACLQQLLNRECQPPWPDPAQASSLAALLDQAKVIANPETLDRHAGLGDQVALVSVADPRDFFSLRVVLPCDANVDMDRISVILPISLAVLGRRTDETVSWETSVGQRLMRIVAVRKCQGAALAE